MKRISKGYFIAAAVLLLWSIIDFYHYVTIGTDLLAHHNGAGIIQRLVNGNLFQGIVKILLCALVLLIGWIRSKGKKNIRSMAVITWLLILSIMGTWLVSMFTLTVVTAQEIYDGLYDQSQSYPDSVSQHGLFSEFYSDDTTRYGYQYERPDFLEYLMLRTIDRCTSASHLSGGNYDTYNHTTGEERHKLIRDIIFPMETAVLFYDADGNLLHSSESDVMYFNYYTQEEWDAGMDSTSGLHYGWIDISEGKNAENWEDDPYLRFRTMYAGTRSLYDIKAIRVTGYFEGTKLIPVVMHYITETLIWPIVESDDQFSTGPNSYSYIVSDVDRTGKLEWQLQFDRSAEYEGKDLVTVYLDRPEMWDYESKSLVYDGKEYESLAALTEALDLPLQDNHNCYNNSVFKLDELLVFGKWTGADFSNKTYFTTGEYTIDFYLVTAIRSNPLACAISALRNIYIATGVLALALLLVVRSNIKKRLVQPISDIAAAMEDGWRNTYRPDNTPAMWPEAAQLHEGYISEQDWRRVKANEINRLNTALEYSKNAEENRRQMVSNIAHEFKTPLAVIHGYAEGLKEHIAEEKRDKYVDVILAESEHLDEMVLELLDLSRLEAGKVKLSQDTFSLAALTHGVFERLEMAVSAKELRVEFHLPEDSTVTADEARIRQVVENFASNAVKYTPDGGLIRVQITRKPSLSNSGTEFSIENDSPPLSEEALNKVWDTFYRTDESRSGGGTGLGLAISKNIVELHGGTCSVRNTKTGVEFQFTI